jgi:hypothetical protein
MSPGTAAEHPAPHAQRMSSGQTWFCLFAGPLAWLLQLACGYALASEPCFRDGGRSSIPPLALEWTWPAMIVLTVAAVAISIAAFILSRRAFDRTRHEHPGGTQQLLEAGAGRTRFLALWGMVLSAGFAVAAAITAVAYIAVPRCAG